MEKITTITDGGTGIEIEQTESQDIITQPFDPTEIRVSTKYMTFDLLLKRIKENTLIISPDFQRNVVWKEGVQSRLIESLLMRIPLPAFYIDATDETKWLVIDGLQRLTALKRFVLDEDKTGEGKGKTLVLSELEFLTGYNGKKYKELPPTFQRRIQETQVTVYLIEPGTPPNVKFNIFKRINTGGLPLSPQEIRHALYTGPVTTFLKRLAESTDFKKATGYGVNTTRMGDREMVLRFLAFVTTPYTQYTKPDLDEFLNNTMISLNKLSSIELKKLEDRFTRAMNGAYNIFGDDAFRKRYKRGDRRLFINKPLFEAWSVNLDKLDNKQLEQLKEQRKQVKQKFIILMNDTEFDKAISQGTGSIRKVQLRFKAIETLITEVLQ